jgi:hypothetical protein
MAQMTTASLSSIAPIGGYLKSVWKSPAQEGFLRARHVSHVRLCAGTRTQKRIEKRRAAGQRTAPHMSYVGDTT